MGPGLCFLFGLVRDGRGRVRLRIETTWQLYVNCKAQIHQVEAAHPAHSALCACGTLLSALISHLVVCLFSPSSRRNSRPLSLMRLGMRFRGGRVFLHESV